MCPPNLLSVIKKSFCDLERSAYGQVATINPNGFPELRTVHLHYLPELDRFAFGCHVDSFKWRDLKAFPALSACYFDTQLNIQFRFQADAELVESEKSPKGAVLRDLWNTVRPDVRSGYWLEEPLVANDIAERAPSYVVVLCEPRLWDVYEVHPEDYRKGTRTIYVRSGNEWQHRKVSLIHSRDIRF